MYWCYNFGPYWMPLNWDMKRSHHLRQPSLRGWANSGALGWHELWRHHVSEFVNIWFISIEETMKLPGITCQSFQFGNYSPIIFPPQGCKGWSLKIVVYYEQRQKPAIYITLQETPGCSIRISPNVSSVYRLRCFPSQDASSKSWRFG